MKDLDDVTRLEFGQEGEDGSKRIVVPGVVGGVSEDDGLVFGTVGSQAEGAFFEELAGRLLSAGGPDGTDGVEFGDIEGWSAVVLLRDQRVRVFEVGEDVTLDLEEGLVEGLVVIGRSLVSVDRRKSLSVEEEETEDQDIEAAEEADQAVAYHSTSYFVSVNDSTLFPWLFKVSVS